MPTDTPQSTKSQILYWAGWILTILLVMPLIMGAVMSFRMPPDFAKNFESMGWKTDLAFTIGVLSLLSVALYVVPQTSVLGAIMLTGYLGGAVATHLRVGETGKSWVPVVFGVLVWLVLLLREPRLRSLLPIRT